MKVLLLSAYTAASHQYWIDGLQTHLPEIDWTVLTLPPRHFSWQIRGNSLQWATYQREVLEQEYDCVLATSMVDLSALCGLVPALASRPSVVYFHENQFAFPLSDDFDTYSKQSIEPQLVNLYSAMSAHRVAFNSQFNRDTFMQGVKILLNKLPDIQANPVLQQLEKKSRVVHVPLLDEVFIPSKDKANKMFNIVWNHRWEYDKGPERLKLAIEQLKPDLPLTFHIVGQQFRQQPKEFEFIRQTLANRGWLGEWGFIENRKDYLKLLASADSVLSTALHDFQGLSVLEGVAAGCLPIVPNRLAYRETIPEQYRYASNLEDSQEEANGLAAMITTQCKKIGNKKESAIELGRFRWRTAKIEYQQLLEF